jgi:hypothetical protein
MSGQPDALVRELALEILDSFEKLEVLVCLVREAKPLTADAIATALRVNKPDLIEPLAQLAREGVIQAGESGYEIVHGGAWAAHVQALAGLYTTDRIQVVTIMSEASLRRLRSQANRAFADAFVIRARKKGDDHG